MAPSIIIFVGLDQVSEPEFPSSIVAILRELKGFGVTPIRFVLMGKNRNNTSVRTAISKAIDSYIQTVPASSTSPKSVSVDAIDTGSEVIDRPECVSKWLAARLSELASGMGSRAFSAESDSSCQSVEANHGSDSDGVNGVVRRALEKNPSPFADTLGCVVVVDNVVHDIAVVGEGHCVDVSGAELSVKDAWRIAQVVRRTPCTASKGGLPDDVLLSGIVKRYNPTKGFGFLTVASQDVFVHQSQIKADGFRGLNIGATVSLRVEMKNGKPEARDVVQKTPYVATFESESFVEGAHRNAGAPCDQRKERRRERSNPLERVSTRTQSAPAPKRTKNSTGVRSASASSAERTRRLVFSGESVPYSFRAHDGTTYYFPMPILSYGKKGSPAGANGNRTISAKMVCGGFGTRAVRNRVAVPPRNATFNMVPSPQAHFSGGRENLQANARSFVPPPYMLSSRNYRQTSSQSPSSPSDVSYKGYGSPSTLPPPPLQTQSFATPQQGGAVRQHSPYMSPTMPTPMSSSGSLQPNQMLPEATTQVRVSPPVGSYAAALLVASRKEAPKDATPNIKPDADASQSIAGIVQLPRRQR